MNTSFITSFDGTQLFCRIQGNGPPLVLVHGACVDGGFFDAAAALLSACFTVYTYDRRGYGRSLPAEKAAFHADAQANDLCAIAAETGSVPYIVAHSLSCSIAAAFAQKRPDQVRKMLLFEPICPEALRPEDPWVQQIMKITELKESGKIISAANRFALLLGPQDPRGPALNASELVNMENNRQAFIHNELDLLSFRFPSGAPCQKLYIAAGELSRGTPFAQMAAYLSEMYQSKIRYYPGGHNCPRDLPLEFSAMTIGLFSAFS